MDSQVYYNNNVTNNNNNFYHFSSPTLPLPTSPPPLYHQVCYNNAANNNNYDHISPLPPPPSYGQMSYNNGFATTLFHNDSSPQLSGASEEMDAQVWSNNVMNNNNYGQFSSPPLPLQPPASYDQVSYNNEVATTLFHNYPSLQLSNGKRGKPPSSQNNKSKQALKKRPTEVKPGSEENNDNHKKCSIKRWPQPRYDAAAKKLADVLRENKRYHDNPMSRSDLRREAKKRIGDTGLLNTLLKHLVDEVIPHDNMERLRRRCDDEGEMEYWLESADLVDIREKAGVVDPYWVPPLGWKLGDAVAVCNCHYLNEIKVLNKKITSMRSEMEELKKAKDEAKQPTVVVTLDDAQSSGSEKTNNMSKKEIYEALMKKKVRLEEQLERISLDLLDVQGHEAC